MAGSTVSFQIEKYGLEVVVPIFPGTGPLVTVPDPSHVRKVLRDNEQSGTHLLTMGDHFLAHNTDRKSTRLNSSHSGESRMPSSA